MVNGQRDAIAAAKTEITKLNFEITRLHAAIAIDQAEAQRLAEEHRALTEAVAPRKMANQIGFFAERIDAQYVPIFISPVSGEEPRGLADDLQTALGLAGLDKHLLPPDDDRWPHVGTAVLAPLENEKLRGIARAICRMLIVQGIKDAYSGGIMRGDERADIWPPTVPETAVVIRIGTKDNLFFVNRQLRRRRPLRTGAELIPPTPDNPFPRCT